uniref:Uncharacterized protein n=1 Tax=Rhizophora mucronata TaxID=61149 RepID=A0A2P2IMS8_RHIMU
MSQEEYVSSLRDTLKKAE